MKIINFKTYKDLSVISILVIYITFCLIKMSSVVLGLGRRPEKSEFLEKENFFQEPISKESSEEIKLYLFLILNQKSPDYFQIISNREFNPWFRLYAIRYLYPWGKAIEKGSQSLHYTFHLNSSLIEGIDGLIAGKKEDIYLTLSKKPTSELTNEDKDFILNYFFYIPKKSNVNFYSRYRELKSLARSLYTNQDFLDLVVLFNLSWLDPSLQRDFFHRYLKRKSHSFTEEEKINLLEKQMEIVRKILPLYKKLQDKKQIEIMVTPSHETILPLVYNTDLAKLPGVDINLPSRNFAYPEDVQIQLAEGLMIYETHFGCYPLGLWLPEGAIVEELFPLFHSFGIKWIFLEEEILKKSQEGKDLYQSYSLEREKNITIFPLHRQISKKINRIYLSHGPDVAVKKLIDRLYRIKKRFKKYQPPKSIIVTLTLEVDTDFIFKLDEVFSKHSDLVTTTYSGWSAECLYSENLAKLQGGSVKGDFSTWIGKERQNRAWDYLFYVRRAVERYKNSGEAKIKKLDEAFEKICTAEEAKWFFQFGQDGEVFNLKTVEEKYNSLLADIYKIVGCKVPGYLIPSSTATVNLTDSDIILRIQDPIGDDNGCGDYVYPMDEVFLPGSFDLEEFSVREDKGYIILTVKLYELENPWQFPLGISFPIIDIYIDLNNNLRAGSTALLPQRDAYTMPKDAWEYCVTINGQVQEIYKVGVDLRPIKIANVKVKVNPVEKTVSAYIPKSFLRGDPRNWGFIPLVLGYENSVLKRNWKVRKVKKLPSQWNFGGGEYDADNPNIIDVILPTGRSQEKILGVYKKGQAVQIPALRYN